MIIELGDTAAEEGEFRQVINEDSTAYKLFGKISGEVNGRIGVECRKLAPKKFACIGHKLNYELDTRYFGRIDFRD